MVSRSMIGAWAYSSVVECWSPKPATEVRILVGPLEYKRKHWLIWVGVFSCSTWPSSRAYSSGRRNDVALQRMSRGREHLIELNEVTIIFSDSWPRIMFYPCNGRILVNMYLYQGDALIQIHPKQGSTTTLKRVSMLLSRKPSLIVQKLALFNLA